MCDRRLITRLLISTFSNWLLDTETFTWNFAVLIQWNFTFFNSHFSSSELSKNNTSHFRHTIIAAIVDVEFNNHSSSCSKLKWWWTWWLDSCHFLVFVWIDWFQEFCDEQVSSFLSIDFRRVIIQSSITKRPAFLLTKCAEDLKGAGHTTTLVLIMRRWRGYHLDFTDDGSQGLITYPTYNNTFMPCLVWWPL